MMSQEAAIKPTHQLWYVAALFVALTGWIVGTTVAAGAWDSVREASVTTVNGPIDASGRSLAMFTDVLQPERDVSCASKEPGDKKPTALHDTAIELSVVDDGTEWHLVDFAIKGRDQMSVTCTPADDRPDNATYAYAVVDGFESRTKAGNGIAILGTALGIGLAVWTFISRRLVFRRARDASS